MILAPAITIPILAAGAVAAGAGYAAVNYNNRHKGVLIAKATCLVSNLREGYRSMRLWDEFGYLLPACDILGHIIIEN